MAGPLVMLGFDGAAWPLVEGWAADGHLPALATLIAEGTRGRIRTPDGFNDNAVWASFGTGREPLRHGWLHYNRVQPGGYRTERVTRDHIDGAPFWQVVSDAGRTVTVLDVPKSPRGRDLNGVELVDWLVHGNDSPVPLSDPPEFVDQVLSEHGPSHRTVCLEYRLADDDLDPWLDERLRMADRKGDLIIEQLRAREADLVVAAFNGGHCIGHQCWHVHDEGHPDHDPTTLARFGDPVLECYQRIDTQIGRIVAELPPDATVVAFAALGMGTNYGATGVLPELLLRLDPIAPRRTLTPAGRAARLWHGLVPLGLRRAMPASWHRAAKRRGEVLRARSSWFPIDTGARSSGVRLNLVGREPDGVVEPGEEREQMLHDLEVALRELVDVDTGETLVLDVERTEHQVGPYAGDLPDLLVHWRPGPAPVRAARSDRVGELVAGDPDRTGHHHAHGFFVVRGPGMRADHVAADARIVDLTATVGALLGVDLGDIDGEPIAEVVDQARLVE
jgi:predicted AlkP superfamily phosphohydrolase/phosphomutase